MLKGALIAPKTANVKRVLHKGLQGNDVKYVQKILNLLNKAYRFCPAKPITPNGYFGNETENLVKFFQLWVGLDYWACFFERFTSNEMEKKYAQYIEFDSEAQLEMARTKAYFERIENEPDPFDKY